MDVVAQVHVVIDLIFHREISHAVRDGVVGGAGGVAHEAQLHRAFFPFGDFLAPRSADEVFVVDHRGVATCDCRGVDHDEPTAALGVGIDDFFFGRFEVSPGLAVDDHNVRRRQLFGGGKGVIATGDLHAGGGEEGHPVAEEGGMIMIAGAVRLRSGADEDAQRRRGGGGSRGVCREDSGNGEQGEEATHV